MMLVGSGHCAVFFVSPRLEEFAKRQYPLSAGWSHWTISTLASFTSHTRPRMVCVRVTLPLTQR